MTSDNKEYKGINIFNALRDIDIIKEKLRREYPEFKFSSEKGDIAEAFAIETYGLSKAPTGQGGYDAISSNGKKVSIKLLWEINPYRSLHLSGGSNQKENAYKDADYLLVLGRDELDDSLCTIYNGSLDLLEEHIKGSATHPRVEVRNLKKLNPLVPTSKKLKPIGDPLPDATPVYYPKDLHNIFGVAKDYWAKFTMLWRNYPCRHIEGVKLQDFLEFNIEQGEGSPLLSLNDMQFLVLCNEFYQRDYDHHTSAFAAYAKMKGIFFPKLIKVSAENLKALKIATSVVKNYKKDEVINKSFSNFFNMQSTGPGGRTLQTYFTPHDISIFERSYEVRGRRNRGTKGGNTDKVNYMKAGRIAAKEIGEMTDFIMPDPRLA